MVSNDRLFSNRKLFNMILPLFIEQLLVLLVGVADTFIISYTGEASVSGVSLVNSINTIFIYVFQSLAAGGAVVVSQYIGRKEKHNASEAISQLLMISVIISFVLFGFVMLSKQAILRMLYREVEPDVMSASLTYFTISAFAYPALAVYNTGTSLFRSVAKTHITMVISLLSNAINIIGNIIGVFVLKAGVAGVAYPTLIAHTFSAVVITLLGFKDNEGVRYSFEQILKWNGALLKRILRIAVPNSFENGIFQAVKVALTGIVALFGTYQIAANGIAQSFWSLAVVMSVCMGPVFITVVGQCMGAGDPDQAEYYFKKLLKITYVGMALWNILMLAITPLALRFYNISDEARALALKLIVLHSVFAILLHPFAFPFGKGLRATGDVKFTTLVVIISSVGMRLMFSFILALRFQMGALGVAYAMFLDWICRILFFLFRFRSGKWKNCKVI